MRPKYGNHYYSYWFFFFFIEWFYFSRIFIISGGRNGSLIIWISKKVILWEPIHPIYCQINFLLKLSKSLFQKYSILFEIRDRLNTGIIDKIRFTIRLWKAHRLIILFFLMFNWANLLLKNAERSFLTIPGFDLSPIISCNRWCSTSPININGSGSGP